MADGSNPRANIMPVYRPPEQAFVKGEGMHMFTDDGAAYLDFISGIAVNALGHCHPALVSALQAQAGALWHTSNMFRVPGAETLAQKMCARLGFADSVFFTNSGTEAVECAIKTARKYHWSRGEPDRIEILTFSGAFHGRSLGAINAGGNPKYLEGFGPALPGFKQLQWDDHDALKAALSTKTAAVFVEPVQGEGGVRAMPEACLTGIRQACDDVGALLIYDEVQCGMGRTGQLFAYEWADNAEPDILCVAKGVGGGFPLGACLARGVVAESMQPGSHGSTYGGNPLAMAVGNAVWDTISDESFLENVRQISGLLTQALKSLVDTNPDKVECMTGKGLLMGLKLKDAPKPVQTICRDNGLLVGVAGNNVLRLAPPLIANGEHIQEATAIIGEALANWQV